MFEIEIDGGFSAAHSLKLYDGSYEPRHGHDWKVRLKLESKKLDSMGVVADFEKLKPVLKQTLLELEGLMINKHPDFTDEKINPSTENIAKWIHEKIQKALPDEKSKIVSVTVWETPDACASYR